MVKVQVPRSLIDNWDFRLVGQSNDPQIPKFKGYVSSIDPTTAGSGVLIGGSQNTYKSLLGTIRNRSGLKLRGPEDNTNAGVITSYEWETALGLTRNLRAANGKLQVEFDDGSGTLQYLDLLSGLTDDEMNFCFTTWYDEDAGKDDLIFVNGKQEINMWGGGLGVLADVANDAGIIDLIRGPNYVGNVLQYCSGGIGYAVGDELTVVGGGGDAVLVVDSISSQTAIDTAFINAAGSGYAMNDIVSINGSTTYALLKITSVNGGGGVTGFSIVGVGHGYALDSNVATTNRASTGSGFTVDIGSLGTTITAWHFKDNGTNYAASSSSTPETTTGGSGSGATIFIESIISGRVTISGTKTLLELGFAGTLTASDSTNIQTGGSFLDNGVSYTYTALGDDGYSFVGITVAGINVGDIVAAPVTVSTETTSGNTFGHVFGSLFTNDWVTTIGNQLYVGCYNSRIVFESNASDYLDYSIPSLRAPGDANLYTLDTNSRGASAKSGQTGNAVLFGSQGDSYSIVNNVETVQISSGPSVFAQVENQTINKQTSSDLSSPISQNFIDSIGDTIIFVDENNQLRQFGTLRNLVTPVYPILSLDVYTELAALDLTGGALRAVAEQSGETIYITAPKSGLLYIYQIREKVDEVGNLGSERLWQPPFVVNASRIAVVDGVTYVYSNVYPQMYQLWDTGQYYDDAPDGSQFPYECHMVLAYQSLGNRVQQLFFDKVYFEGYMPRGTQLFCSVYQEYQGAAGIRLLTVNNPETPPAVKRARFYDNDNAPEIGQVSLGNVPLGQGVAGTGDASVPKFRAIRAATVTSVFEFALDVFSNTVDAQWEMLVLGTNMMGTPGRSTQLQKKEL